MKYEWKDSTGHLHKVEFGPTVSAAIELAAQEDAVQYGISLETAKAIIINGMVAAEIAVEEVRRTK